MEDTVSHLEAMFQKADSDLNYLERKLEFECGKDGVGEGQVNSQQLVEKVGQVKKDYAALVAEVQGIQQSQQEAVEFFRSQLTAVTDMLSELQSPTGKEGGEPPDFEALAEMLGMKLPTSVIGDSPAASTGAATLSEAPGHGETTHTSTESTEPPAATTSSLGQQFDISPHARRKGCTECIDLTQEEFESVSTLVRGRVKLADVNQTYQRLWQHFKDEGNSESLGAQEMFKMGLKVSGATGEAKLKVLKALKLITMDRKGAVNLV